MHTYLRLWRVCHRLRVAILVLLIRVGGRLIVLRPERRIVPVRARATTFWLLYVVAVVLVSL